MRLALLIVYCLLTAPVQAALTLYTDEQTLIHGRMRIGIYGISSSFSICILRKEAPVRLYVQVFKSKKQLPLRFKKSKKKRLTKVFPPLARQLKSWQHCIDLMLYFRLGMPNAAATALMCGAARQAFSTLPLVHAKIMPDYQHAGYCIQLCCIASFRLGKLCLTAALWGLALIARKFAGGAINGKRNKSANQPSDANSA